MGQISSKQAAIGAGVAVTAVLGGIYVHHYKQEKNKMSAKQLEEIKQEQPQQVVQEEEKNEFDLAFINKVNKELADYQNQGKPLSLDTLIKIFEAGFKSAKAKYAELQVKNRAERRKSMGNPQLYTNVVLQFNDELERLLTDGQQKLCNLLHIHSEIFEQSFMHYMQSEQNAMRITMVQMELRKQLISAIQSTKQIDDKLFLEATDYQIEVLKNGFEFKKYIDCLQPEQQDLVGVLISVILSDFLFKKLNLEEEDLVQNLQRNPQNAIQYQRIQESVIQMMQQIYS